MPLPSPLFILPFVFFSLVFSGVHPCTELNINSNYIVLVVVVSVAAVVASTGAATADVSSMLLMYMLFMVATGSRRSTETDNAH